MGGDHDYGKVVHLARHNWLHTKAVYPIMALCVVAFGLGGTSVLKHIFGNPHVSFDRDAMGNWNQKKPLVWGFRGGSKPPSDDVLPPSMS